MNTPNETPENQTAPDAPQGGADGKPAKGKRPDRTQRAAFWLRAIDVRKHTLTHEYRKSLRDTAHEGISDEEYAAMLATLEKMARNLGWDESQKDERPFGRGFGRGHRHPAMMRGFGPGHGFGHDHHHDHDGEHGHDAGAEHEHRYPGAKRGFGRMHPRDRDRDLRTETPPMNSVTTDTPQA